MNDTLTVGNVTLSGNLVVLDCNDDDAPEPDYEAISVPGRSGDLHIWNERWKNKLITYHCMCRANARTAVPALLTQLLSQYGYQRITDSLHTTYYKMGEYVGATTPVYSDGGQTARFDLTFDCKPQKWLISGDTETVYSAQVTLTNPTRFPAYPTIGMYKNSTAEGSVTITHTNTYTLTNTYAYSSSTTHSMVVYDCGTEDAYSRYVTGSTSAPNPRNNYITRTGASGKIYLQANGTTTISFSGSISKVYITPRWYTL